MRRHAGSGHACARGWRRRAVGGKRTFSVYCALGNLATYAWFNRRSASVAPVCEGACVDLRALLASHRILHVLSRTYGIHVRRESQLGQLRSDQIPSASFGADNVSPAAVKLQMKQGCGCLSRWPFACPCWRKNVRRSTQFSSDSGDGKLSFAAKLSGTAHFYYNNFSIADRYLDGFPRHHYPRTGRTWCDAHQPGCQG